MKYAITLRTLTIFSLLILNIGCDQVSKKMVRSRLDYYEQISLVNNYLTLTKVENSGAFLSLGSGLPHHPRTMLLTVLPLLVLMGALGYLIFKRSLSNLKAVGLCSIVGGGIGNIYDRILYGSVTDFLHIDFVVFQTGIFNLADVSIMIGTFLIFMDSYFNVRSIREVEKA